MPTRTAPYIVPIYFAYEPDHIYGFTTLGQKVEWMRANPLVCVEVDEVLSHFRWSSVVVVGRYENLPTRLNTAKSGLKPSFDWKRGPCGGKQRPPARLAVYFACRDLMYFVRLAILKSTTAWF